MMSDDAAAKRTRQSSPRYPFIGLGRALDRTEQLKKAAGNNAVLVSDARTTWGYGPKSSGGDQTVAALKAYGLIDDMDEGPKRKLKLTESASRFFRDERREVRAELMQQFAMNPKAVKQLWGLWGHTPPDDHIARSILKVDFHFSDSAASEFLAVYQENLTFIKAEASDIISEGGGLDKGTHGEPKGDVKASVKVGDYVQWTSDGVDQFKVPPRVIGILPDGLHVQLFGSNTGVPMSEITVVPAPSATPPAIKAEPVSAASAGVQGDNDFNVLLRGNRLQITADVDLEGIAMLKDILANYESILRRIGGQKQQ